MNIHKPSQRPIQNEPIFRLLLKVAVKRVHPCEFRNFSWVYPTNTCASARRQSTLLSHVSGRPPSKYMARTLRLAPHHVPHRPPLCQLYTTHKCTNCRRLRIHHTRQRIRRIIQVDTKVQSKNCESEHQGTARRELE